MRSGDFSSRLSQFFFVSLRFVCFSSLLFVFFVFLLIFLGQEQTTAIYWKNGEFHSDLVCTDPVQNFSKSSAGWVSDIPSNLERTPQEPLNGPLLILVAAPVLDIQSHKGVAIFCWAPRPPELQQ